MIAYAVVVGVLALMLLRPGRTSDRVTTGALAGLWLWLGALYAAMSSSRPACSSGPGSSATGCGSRPALASPRGSAGLPSAMRWWSIRWIGSALGHGWPQGPLFGMAPCPSTIVTFGLLLLVAPPLPTHLLVIPAIWAVLAPLAAVGHGVLEDLGLAVVGLTAVTIVLVRDRGRPPPTDRVRAGDAR